MAVRTPLTASEKAILRDRIARARIAREAHDAHACECGCGEPTDTRFVRGHHNRLRGKPEDSPEDRLLAALAAHEGQS